MSWYAHLPGKFGQAALDVCEYMNEALGAPASASGAAVSSAAARSRRLRSTYRALGDLRAEFQRTMSEPPSISRSAAAWWPAVVGLEQVLDAVTSVSVAVSRSASVPPSGVRQLCAALHAVSEAASAGTPLPADLELPDDKTLEPITGAVRALLGVLASGERLASPLGAPPVGVPGSLAGGAFRRRWPGSLSGVVGLAGFEPAASATQTRRQLAKPGWSLFLGEVQRSGWAPRLGLNGAGGDSARRGWAGSERAAGIRAATPCVCGWDRVRVETGRPGPGAPCRRAGPTRAAGVAPLGRRRALLGLARGGLARAAPGESRACVYHQSQLQTDTHFGHGGTDSCVIIRGRDGSHGGIGSVGLPGSSAGSRISACRALA